MILLSCQGKHWEHHSNVLFPSCYEIGTEFQHPPRVDTILNWPPSFKQHVDFIQSNTIVIKGPQSLFVQSPHPLGVFPPSNRNIVI